MSSPQKVGEKKTRRRKKVRYNSLHPPQHLPTYTSEPKKKEKPPIYRVRGNKGKSDVETMFRFYTRWIRGMFGCSVYGKDLLLLYSILVYVNVV